MGLELPSLYIGKGAGVARLPRAFFVLLLRNTKKEKNALLNEV